MPVNALFRWVSLVGVVVGSAPAVAVAQAPPFDLLIRGGRVLDGTGNPWYRADVGITGDRVVAVGDLSGTTATRSIDATDLYVAPGFIDVHSHAADGLATSGLSHAQPLLAQGVTTVVVNPDGGGDVDLVAQRSRLMEHGLGVNVALLVPHGSIRRAVVGMEDRGATNEELARMRGLVERGMEAGAFGLSTGLYYAPGSYATTGEVIDLARVAAKYGGVYTSHIRDEADYTVGVIAAVDEVIRVAREASLPAVVTHVKALGPRVWGFSGAIVQRIERARREGVEVWADQYPYEASATSLTGALVPRWALAGGDAGLQARLLEPAARARIRGAVLENLERRGGAARLQFRRHAADPSIEGLTLDAVARARSVEPADLVLALLAAGGAGIVSFNMQPDDLETLTRQPWMMTASDGDLVPWGEGVPHPRSYGTFPRKIKVYAVERGMIDLATAVRSMTGLPATVFRFSDRGFVRPGAIADVVVFDLDEVDDPATYQEPHQLARGMVYVLVNGQMAIDRRAFAGVMAGTVLDRREQKRER